MKTNSFIRKAAIAAVAGFAAIAVAASAYGGEVSIGINVGVAPPPPPREVTVVSYDTYVVGYRRNLYDSDWRLRTAQCDEIAAQRDLEAARAHEGEIAIAMDNQEASANDLRHMVEGAAAGGAEARVRLGALEKRIASARSDLDSARVLRDGPGIADAERRLHDNEAAAAATADEIRRAEDAAAARDRLAAAEGNLARIRADFEVAHDAVFGCQNRLADAHERVCIALHDRDEAMWLLYRDDIMLGRIRPESVGFAIDLNAFGGRMPRDPEVLHAYIVHDSGYWRTRPVEIENRVVVVDRCPDVIRIRDVERSHEGVRYTQVTTIESSVTIEQRRAGAERIVVERTRFENERNERTVAVREGRKPQVSPQERADAKATVMQAHADAKATEMQAHADAKATEMKAHADAKATEMQAHADAKATKETAHADAKSTEMKAHADAKSEEMGAHADAKAKVTEAHGDAKAKETTAHGDAKAAETTAHGDAKAAETTAHGDAKAKETTARGDAKSKETTARGDSKSQQTDARANSRTSKDDKSGKSKNGKKDPRDPNNPNGTASTDGRY